MALKNIHKLHWLLLLLAAVGPYLSLLHGQFIFDDYLVIETNKTLNKVGSFWDCFFFVLKPSKPVSNFFIALGHGFGRGPMGQRLLTLFFHAANVILFYTILQKSLFAPKRLDKRATQVVSYSGILPLGAALFFALAPVHSEAIGVALFRMDILGSFFTLVAMSVLLKFEKEGTLKLVLLFILMGLASLSKEVFVLLAPLSVFFFTRTTQRSIRRLCFFSVLIWGSVVFVKLQQDQVSEFPYGDVLGYTEMGLKDHLQFASRALMEALVKLGTGFRLTSIRLADRAGLGSDWPLWLNGVVLLLFFSLVASIRGLGKREGAWALIFWSGLGIYLFIPNINIGSEHYLYFPALGFFAILIFVISQLYQKLFSNTERMLWLTVVAFAVTQFVVLEKRVWDMKSRVDFNFAELHTHPESAVAWNNVAVAIMETKANDRFQLAKPFLDKAKRLSPHYPNILVTEFLYYLNVGDKVHSKEALRTLDQVFAHEPEKLARYYRYFGLIEENG